MCSYKAKLCGLLCVYIGIMLAIAFALLEQATATTTFATTITDTTSNTTGVTPTGSIEDNFPAPHIPTVSMQFAMHSEGAANVVGNFQSNMQ